MRYEQTDHSADLGIHVFGSDQTGLFENAAFALFDLMADIRGIQGETEVAVKAGGEDWADLLVNWLRELLELWNLEGLIATRVRVESLREFEIRAKADCFLFDPEKHVVKKEIKAVTYHQPRVQAGPSTWEGWIVLDV